MRAQLQRQQHQVAARHKTSLQPCLKLHALLWTGAVTSLASFALHHSD